MKRVLIFISAAVAVAAALWFGARYYRAAPVVDSSRLAKLESENRELRARSEQLAQEIDARRQGLPTPAAAGHPVERGAARPADTGQSVEQARLLIQFREKLASANSTIEALETRRQALQAQIDEAAVQNQRLAASEAELKERVAGANRVLEAVQNELKGKEGRVWQLEEANVRLREESRQNADKAAQAPKLVRELEDLNRRRETYLNNILRRYRELTDQYRGLATRLETSDGSAELGRIQNTISMTEEDLRQLSSLNAQAGRLQQKMGGR